jgi:predicted SnoaL-like aldol condensation-catalyzing enzyme
MPQESPATILFDEFGNPIGVIFDGVEYRLQTQTTIVDGYGDGPVAVKPPNTPAVATDPALVVAISPNNPILTSNPSVSATGATPPSSATYIGGSVTTLAPTYVAGQMDPVSLTTSGLLRVDGSGVTQPVSGTVLANQGTPNTLANAWPVEITDGYHVLGTVSNPLQVNFDGYIQSNPNVIVTNFPTQQHVIVDGYVVLENTSISIGAVSQGTPNILSNAWPVEITDGYSILGTVSNPLQVNIDGYVQTNPVVIQGTNPWIVSVDNFPSQQHVIVDGYIFLASENIDIGTVNQGIANTLANAWPVEITDGYSILGTASNPLQVNIDGYVQTNPVVIQGTNPWVVSGTVTSNQGSPNTLVNAWPVEITDGYNILGTVLHPLQVNIDGYVQTNPNVIVTNFPAQQHVIVDGYVVLSNATIDIGMVDQGAPNILANAWPVEITDGYNVLGTVLNPLQVNIDGYVQTNPVVIQGTNPWIVSVSNFPTDQHVIVDGYVDVIVTNFPSISGTVTSNQGTSNTLANAWPVEITDGYNILGTVTNPLQVSIDGYVQTNPVVIQGTNPWTVNGTVTSNQGTPNTLSNAWPVEITDGYNILGTATNPLQINVDGYVQTNPNVIVTNFPMQQHVIVDGYVQTNPVVVQGTNPWIVNVDNFPVQQHVIVDGYVVLANASIDIGKVDQGIPAILSNAWPVEITDGYNILGTVLNPLQVNIDGYVQTNPNVIVTNFPAQQHVIVDGYVQTNPHVIVDNFPSVTGTVTANQGTPNILSDAWPVEITDGYNILGTAMNPLQVNIDGYVQTNPVVIQGTNPWIVSVTNFPVDQHVIVDGYVQTNPVVVQGTNPWTVNGTVNVGNFPVDQHVIVDGYVQTNPVVIQGTTPWIVNVANFPADQHVIVDGYVQTNPVVIQGTNPWTINGTVISNQGTPNTLTNAWPVEITDGTNVLGTVTNPLQINVDGYVQTNPVVIQGTNPWTVNGTVNVGNFPTDQHVIVDGYVQTNPVVIQGTNPWVVSVNNFPVDQHVIVDGYVQTNPVVLQGTSPWVVSGTVNVGNFPVDQHVIVDGYVQTNPVVIQGTNPWTVNGTVNIGNFPVDQHVIVDGYVQTNPVVVQGTTPWIVSISNFPVDQHVIVDGYVQTNPVVIQGTNPWTVNGTVNVGNFPTDQHVIVDGYVQTNPVVIQGTNPWTVNGTVNVGNFPTDQHVIVDGYVQTNPVVVQGTTPWIVSISNFPVDQHVIVDGYVQTNPVVIQGTNPWTVNGTVTSNQGTPNTLANAWPVEITDGTNVLGTVAHPLQVNVDGYVQTNPVVIQGTNPWIVSGTVNIGNFPVDQHVIVDGYVQTNPVVFQGTNPWIVSGTVTSNQGTPNTLANAWPVKFTDGYGQLFGEPNNPINVTGSISVVNLSVGPTASPPPADATYVGALVTTAMESGLISGDMYPFNLTTTGLLRIDGAYPLATAVGTAVDMHQVGGAVTTANPAYANTTINALSLTTIGQLRVLADQGVPNTLSNAWPVELTDGYGQLFGQANHPIFVSGDGGIFNSSAISTVGVAPPTAASYIGALTATNAPSYSSGVMEPLSLTLAGLLRIDGVYPINATTPTTDGTFVAGAVTTTAPTYITGQMSALSLDTAGNLRVSGSTPVDIFPATQNITTQDLASTTTTGTHAQTIITGTPTANSAASFTISTEETVIIQVTGTWTGTLQTEISEDAGVTWYLRFIHLTGTDYVGSSFTTNFNGGANVAGYTNIRVRATTAMTGTAIVKISESLNNNIIHVINAIRLTDGYDGIVAVKPPNTPAVATDIALVVALSPNNSVTTSIAPKYGTNNQTITISLASLASAGARASTAVDNTTNLYKDAFLFFTVKTGASGTSTTGYINIYGYGSVDGGSTYPEGITGTDGGVTLTVPPNLSLIGQINTVANATTYKLGPISFCTLYGLPTLPQKWGIVVSNQSGHALDVTAGNFSVIYQGIN